MGTININLLENRYANSTLNDYTLSTDSNAYNIVAGEQNATKFKIIKSSAYDGYNFYVEMVNSQRKGIAPTLLENDSSTSWIISDTEFYLPTGMAVAGYGYISITAMKNGVKIIWLPIKVKVSNTIPEWEQNVDENKCVDIADFEEFKQNNSFIVGNVNTETLSAGSSAQVIVASRHDDASNKTYTDMTFRLPKGDKGDKGDTGEGFTISKTYSSVAAMNAGYATDNVPLYGFVLIDTGDVENPENSRLYMKKETAYEFLNDLSGAQGIKGETGDRGYSILYTSENLSTPPEGGTATTGITIESIRKPDGYEMKVDDLIMSANGNYGYISDIGVTVITCITLGSIKGARGDDGYSTLYADYPIADGASAVNHIEKSSIRIPDGYTIKLNDLIVGNTGAYGYISYISGTIVDVVTLGSLKGDKGDKGDAATIEGSLTATINGTKKTYDASADVDLGTIYPPSSLGTDGYLWESNGSTNPSWQRPIITNVNGSITRGKTVYAPTSAGTDGYILVSNGSGAPSWINLLGSATLRSTLTATGATYNSPTAFNKYSYVFISIEITDGYDASYIYTFFFTPAMINELGDQGIGYTDNRAGGGAFAFSSTTSITSGWYNNFDRGSMQFSKMRIYTGPLLY